MKEEEIKITANRSSEHLRERSLYDIHADEVRHGKLDHSVTPPAILNLELIKQMPSLVHIERKMKGRAIQLSLLGIAEPSMVHDFGLFVRDTLHADIEAFSVVDLDRDMVDRVQMQAPDFVVPLHADAQKTGIPENSQDIVFRDHLGNCCPPEVDKQINKEVARILKPGGISMVNITTSELLRTSGREIILHNQIPEAIKTKLQTEIYDVEGLKQEIPLSKLEMVNGKLLEIASPDSFVIFDDVSGDGEWFRTIGEHIQNWNDTGLHIIDLKMRLGSDSHTPSLPCIRFNVILQKV